MMKKLGLSYTEFEKLQYVGETIVLFEALSKVGALLGQAYSLKGAFDAS